MCLINLSNCSGKLVLAGHRDRTIEYPYHQHCIGKDKVTYLKLSWLKFQGLAKFTKTSKFSPLKLTQHTVNTYCIASNYGPGIYFFLVIFNQATK